MTSLINPSPATLPIYYVLDTNVLIHDPNAPLNFQEHTVFIPITVLEELDNIKMRANPSAAEARQAIRLIDRLLGDCPVDEVGKGVAINRGKDQSLGHISTLLRYTASEFTLNDSLNDNIIINLAIDLSRSHPEHQVILVSKDINMRVKAKACGLDAQDYVTDKLIDDIDLLPCGYHEITGSFWDLTEHVETKGDETRKYDITLIEPFIGLLPNQFVVDDSDTILLIKHIDGLRIKAVEMHRSALMNQDAWGLKPQDIYQAFAMYALLDQDIHLVNLSGPAGSGKTILALAAAIEQAMVSKAYNKIIVTRSVQGIDEDIGFLPGTETEKMLPWLGAFTDNLEALHVDDECTQGSLDYLLGKMPIQFKSLNYIRGRSFQQSFIIIDESQNLTPHQLKTILTRAGQGSKVICLGNLSQIDTPFLSATSSGLTYMTERMKGFKHAQQVILQGVPRSSLAQYAEEHM